MDVRAEINKIIAFVKTQPNGLARNKVISHLVDAGFAANELDTGQAKAFDPSGGCACPEGAIRTDCPVHGKK